MWQLESGSDTVVPLADQTTILDGKAVDSLAWARDGTRLLFAAATNSGQVRFLQMLPGADTCEPFARPLTISSRRGGVGSLALAWDGEGSRLLLAASGGDGQVRLWQVLPGEAPEPFGLPLRILVRARGVTSLAWAREGSRLLLAASGGDGQVQVLQVLPGEAPEPFGLPLRFLVRARGVTSLAWAREGSRLLLAASGGDGQVRLWQVLPGVEAKPFGQPLATPSPGGLAALAWAREGTRLLLAAGSSDGQVHLWHVDPGADAAESSGQLLTVPNRPVRSLAWARDESRLLLAAGCDDGQVHLWQVQAIRAVPRPPEYRSDGLGELAADELDRDGEARAVAELVTARTASPPLAVGLFGDWGEGKSHFLELLRRRVRTLSDNPLACRHVRQVRFNAWHYSETSLWASLVAELFAQLAAPPEGDAGTAQRQMSRLTADLVAQRRARERLSSARQRRDDLQYALARPDVPWKALDADQRQTIIEAAGVDLPAEALYREGVGTFRVLRAAGRNAKTLIVSAGRSAWLWFALALAVSASLLGVAWAWPYVSHWMAAFGLVSLVPAYHSAAARVREAWRQLGTARTKFGRAVEALRAPLQTAADVAVAEVAALELELQNLTAAGQLAGLISERAASSDYRSQLGLMTQIREDFQHMAQLLAQASQQQELQTPDGTAASVPRTDEAQDELPQIDRIIVYIDDLVPHQATFALATTSRRRLSAAWLFRQMM